jgi:hypothetical protein
VFDPPTMELVLREVARPALREADRTLMARCGAPLGLLLRALGPGHFDSVLAAAARADLEPIRAPLFEYLARHAVGNELKLGKLLADTDLSRARTILAILSRVNTDDARIALRRAEKNASAELRVEAAALRAQRSTHDLKDELGMLSADSDPRVRAAALRTMSRYKVKEAGPALVQRIHSGAFHKLPPDERRLALQTLYDLSPARAELVALELATKTSMITRDAFDETRIVGLELLAQVSADPGILKDVEKISKKWSNTEDVRAAATAAAAAIRTRSETTEAP